MKILLLLIGLAVALYGVIYFATDCAGPDTAPTYVEYYSYPHGPNGTLVKLPVAECFPACSRWAAQMVRDGQPDWFTNKDGMHCIKRWH